MKLNIHNREIPADIAKLLKEPANRTWQGGSPVKWANHIEKGLAEEIGLHEMCMTTDAVRGFCRNLNNSMEASFVVCAAWGRMRIGHLRDVWKKKTHWAAAINSIRIRKDISRRDAYQTLAELREHGDLPGMGPAYFTKIIFLMRENPDGYIMDQWTSKSVNVLIRHGGLKSSNYDWAGPRMTWAGYVDDTNTPEDYQEFCCYIEAIAEMLGTSPHECEQRLFSGGGARNRGKWRDYVVNAWNTLNRKHQQLKTTTK